MPSTCRDSSFGGHSSDFTYDELPDPAGNIRLLSINRVLRSSVICNIVTRSLSEEPLYTAISYMWGCPDKTAMIVVNGKRLPVTQSCRQALEQVHQHRRGHHVWIDAVCINQASISEKSEQVGIMGSIYARAQGVLAVLGAVHDFQDEGQMAARVFKAIFPHISLIQTVTDDPAKSRARELITTINKHISFGDLAAFRFKVRTHPYWYRAWIRQEILLADQLIISYSGYLASWSDWRTVTLMVGRLASVCQLMIEQGDDVLCGVMGEGKFWCDDMLGLSVLLFHKGNLHTEKKYIDDFLDMGVSYRCKEPRDIVYSIISLLSRPSWCRDAITPDYSKSIFEVAWETLDYFGSPDSLYYGRPGILHNARSLLTCLQIDADNDDIRGLVERRSGSELIESDTDTERILSGDCLDLPATLLENSGCG